MEPNDYLPQWGQLPVEQYLIRCWDTSSQEAAEQQRRRLVHQFLNIDRIPSECVRFRSNGTCIRRHATAEEIDTILRPWRSDQLRRIAWRIWKRGSDQPIVLRTHYDSNDDATVTEWTESSDEIDEDKAWWALLNDPNLFDFGERWDRVFELLPELAGPSDTGDYSRLPDPGLVEKRRRNLKEHLQSVKATNRWNADRVKCIEAETVYLRQYVTKGFVCIADREMFETGLIRLIYLDGKANVVQEARLEYNEDTLATIAVEWDQLSMPTEIWERGTIGDQYRLDGELGRQLYRLGSGVFE